MFFGLIDHIFALVEVMSLSYQGTNITLIQCWPTSMLPYDVTGHIELTHWGWVTHICVGNLTIIGSDNGLSPGRHQAITWTNVGILLIGPLGTNFSEMLIEIHTFSFKKIHLKMSSGKRRPFCLGLNVLNGCTVSCQDRLNLPPPLILIPVAPIPINMWLSLTPHRTSVTKTCSHWESIASKLWK